MLRHGFWRRWLLNVVLVISNLCGAFRRYGAQVRDDVAGEEAFHVEDDDEALGVSTNAADAARSPWGADIGWRPDLSSIKGDYLDDAVGDEPDDKLMIAGRDLEDDDPGVIGDFSRRQSKPAAQVDDRHGLSADVCQAGEVAWCVRQPEERAHRDDFGHAGDWHRKNLVAEPEGDEV